MIEMWKSFLIVAVLRTKVTEWKDPMIFLKAIPNLSDDECRLWSCDDVVDNILYLSQSL